MVGNPNYRDYPEDELKYVKPVIIEDHFVNIKESRKLRERKEFENWLALNKNSIDIQLPARSNPNYMEKALDLIELYEHRTPSYSTEYVKKYLTMRINNEELPANVLPKRIEFSVSESLYFNHKKAYKVLRSIKLLRDV